MAEGRGRGGESEEARKRAKARMVKAWEESDVAASALFARAEASRRKTKSDFNGDRKDLAMVGNTDNGTIIQVLICVQSSVACGAVVPCPRPQCQ